MRIPQIRMESQAGKIGLATYQPIQKIEQPQADITIEQPTADLGITHRPSRLTIDQTLAWDNLDLKNVFKRVEESANKGFQAAMEFIRRESQEGDELMNIAKVKNPIAKQASRAISKETPYDTGSVPSSESVQIDYVPASVDINVRANKPQIQVQAHKPIHEYTPGSTDVYMLQYPSLKIDVTG
ncbi:hypothetical protein EKG37_02110 [Robertmurraya yapensis]|uniref:YviE n=1 Tax=Bacillus yapensis TaxID=2492960 RepID=A0A431WLR1_9BACI|nr:DUF6470 family protein [Bacillus yapensis]RTR36373.1 hypothetical protein EKG37_02110 [Bacillus yapensis]TKT05877.1 hypothetical protein FAR12_02110 [Bacillus yapensis]